MRASTTPKLASNIMYPLAAVSASDHVALYVTFRTDMTGYFGFGGTHWDRLIISLRDLIFVAASASATILVGIQSV
jgi:hypothetical protein